MKLIVSLLLSMCPYFLVKLMAQPAMNKYAIASIRGNLELLKQNKRLLYIGLMPGEENTLLLTVMRKKYHFQTAYFMLTRGERQQNFGGLEKGIDLGIIHSSEMEAAGQIGHFDLFASSYMDIGSRDSSTLFSIWNRQHLLTDMVTVIRSYQPDIIIIGRTDPQDSSANWLNSLCLEANQLAANKKYPKNGQTSTEINKHSLIINQAPYGASWIFAEMPMAGDSDTSTHMAVETNITDAGHDLFHIHLLGYDSVSGMTYREIALKSKQEERSMYADLNNIPLGKDSLLLQQLFGQGVFDLQHSTNMGLWNRVQKGKSFQEQISTILSDYAQPFANRKVLINKLADLYMKVQQTIIDEGPRKKIAEQLKSLILNTASLKISANADRDLGVLGQDFNLTVNIQDPLNSITIQKISLGDLLDTSFTQPLGQIQSGKSLRFEKKIHLPLFQPAYQPFWLNNPWNADNSYQIDSVMQGRLVDTACYQVHLIIQLDSLPVELSIPVVYHQFDRNKGQLVRPFYTVEPLLLMQTPDVLLTQIEGDTKPNKHPEITLRMKTLFQDTSILGIIKIRQMGLQAEIDGQVLKTGETQEIYKNATYISPQYDQSMHITLPYDETFAKKWHPQTPILKPQVLLRLPDGAQAFSSNIKAVGYPYQKNIIYNFHSQTIIIGDTIQTKGTKIAYIGGETEDVWQNAFHQLGYQVTKLTPSELLKISPVEDLLQPKDGSDSTTDQQLSDSIRKFDVIVWNALPAYNKPTAEILKALRLLLSAFVNNGGRILNISTGKNWTPAIPGNNSINQHIVINDTSFTQISADDQHPLFNYPNQLSTDHFTKWFGSMAYGSIKTGSPPERLPIKIQRKQNNEYDYPVSLQESGNGTIIHCFLNLPDQFSKGSPFAFKFLANLLANPSENISKKKNH